MKRMDLVVAVLALGAGSLFFGAVASASVTKVKSTVTITSGEGSEFTGKVKAGQKACRSGRKVKLFMEPYSGEEDELVGTATTNASGAWTIEGSFMAGMYHAEVASRTVHAGGDTFRCQVDLSVSAKF
jgi:hypothetical protein